MGISFRVLTKFVKGALSKKSNLLISSSLEANLLIATTVFSSISGFASENGKVQFIDEKTVVAMSKLASKEELMSKLLFLLNAPLTNFVRTLNEIPTKFVRTLSAIADRNI